MFAVVKIGGQQYKVAERQKIKVEKLPEKEGNKITLDQVLLFVDGEKIQIGTPLLAKVKIEAKIISQGKRPKVKIFKFKPKKRYKKLLGHRQTFTEIEIQHIRNS